MNVALFLGLLVLHTLAFANTIFCFTRAHRARRWGDSYLWSLGAGFSVTAAVTSLIGLNG